MSQAPFPTQRQPLHGEDLHAEPGVLRAAGQVDGQGEDPGPHGQRLGQEDFRVARVGLWKLELALGKLGVGFAHLYEQGFIVQALEVVPETRF